MRQGRNDAARLKLVSQFPHKLVVFFRQDDIVGNASGGDWMYIEANKNVNGRNLAHEIGHYLHLSHPHPDISALFFKDEDNKWAPCINAPEKDKAVCYAQLTDELRGIIAHIIEDYVKVQGHSWSEGLNVLDGDGLESTPPDLAPILWRL